MGMTKSKSPVDSFGTPGWPQPQKYKKNPGSLVRGKKIGCNDITPKFPTTSYGVFTPTCDQKSRGINSFAILKGRRGSESDSPPGPG